MKIDLEFLKKKSEKRFTGLLECNHLEVLMIVNHNIGPFVARRPDPVKVHDYESIAEMLIDYKKLGYLDGFESIQFHPDIANFKEVYTIPLTLVDTLIKESGNEQD